MRKITTSKGVELLVPEKGEKHPGAGRPKGAKNVMTREVKEAILLAAAESQHAKDYGGGLAGYCTYLATEWPEIFARRLLARLLPRQKADKTVEPGEYRTAEEARAAPIARGVRVRKVDKGTQSSNVIDGPFKSKT
jgi:hypothetical protein